ncbi:SLBB domain-containing protein [Alkalimonas collagenimarina]|uniref:SLBB domain-containing protein n=1 Tax=Alkalimonas collagenimarina TaxID=400390 RepID=A0ABT9H0R7_9GAMM|nr:SLBB domain-containing protein [Alkalimonas collagenimarina]MDP4536898.1 SLBB domain-containing protein [Alkalimonas collagenimarina]
MVSKFLRILAVFSVCWLALPAVANVTPSPAMMEQFRQLPRAEQERLAKQYGIDLNQLQRQPQGQRQDQRQDPTGQQQRQQRELLELEKDKEKDDGKPKRFGMNLFDAEISTFAPVGNVPVPDSYQLGPDDTLLLQFFGKQFVQYELVVSRDGQLSIPDLGTVQLAGLTFAQARRLITERVAQSMIGVEVAVSMGPMRSINIMVAGEAKYPGTYTVSALSTVTQALFAAGGVSEIGALREIHVNRAGDIAARFDLYDLLLRGDSRQDIHLQNGDVVFVAPVQAIAEVRGEVRRPALFEVKANDDLASLLAMAGGVREGGYPKAAVLERFNQDNLRDLLNVDLTHNKDRQVKVQAGDVLRVGGTSPRLTNSITLAGAFVRPGHYAWRDDIRVSDVIRSLLSDVHLTTDLDYLIVLREINSQGDIEVHQFSLVDALEHPQSAANLRLAPRDIIMAFHQENYSYQRHALNQYLREKLEDNYDRPEELRWLSSDQLANQAFEAIIAPEPERKQPDWTLLQQQMDLMADREMREALRKQQEQDLQEHMLHILQQVFVDAELLALSAHLSRTELMYPVLQKLRSQARNGQTPQLVSVSGEVKVPGEYPLAKGGQVADLVRAAGGLNESAFITRAELTRAKGQPQSEQGVRVEHLQVNLQQELNGGQQLALQSRDRLNVFAIPQWRVDQTIELRGEVRFPGLYTIQQGETLAQVIQRAGGVTQNAFVNGAVFTREHLRERESEQLRSMVSQLRSEIATRSLSAESVQASPQDTLTMINQLEMQDTVGRLVVNLPYIIAGDPTADLLVEDGDTLHVPRRDTSISVMGEVQHAGTHRFNGQLTVDDYIRLAGGTRQRADTKRVYVIRADGSVMLSNNRWFRGRNEALQPGDTIIVPLDTEYKDNITLWAQVTQIFYQSAVALAAISRI